MFWVIMRMTGLGLGSAPRLPAALSFKAHAALRACWRSLSQGHTQKHTHTPYIHTYVQQNSTTLPWQRLWCRTSFLRAHTNTHHSPLNRRAAHHSVACAPQESDRDLQQALQHVEVLQRQLHLLATAPAQAHLSLPAPRPAPPTASTISQPQPQVQPQEQHQRQHQHQQEHHQQAQGGDDAEDSGSLQGEATTGGHPGDEAHPLQPPAPPQQPPAHQGLPPQLLVPAASVSSTRIAPSPSAPPPLAMGGVLAGAGAPEGEAPVQGGEVMGGAGEPQGSSELLFLRRRVRELMLQVTQCACLSACVCLCLCLFVRFLPCSHLTRRRLAHQQLQSRAPCVCWAAAGGGHLLLSPLAQPLIPCALASLFIIKGHLSPFSQPLPPFSSQTSLCASCMATLLIQDTPLCLVLDRPLRLIHGHPFHPRRASAPHLRPPFSSKTAQSTLNPSFLLIGCPRRP